MEFCRVYEDDNNTLTYSITDYWDSAKTGQHVEMHIERDEDPEVYAEFSLPAYHCHHAYGFKDSDLTRIEEFLRNNAVSIWDMARGY
ncbi:MAG: hypothetical protein IJ849_05680 [Selenomonadaceae bacterium]|nr:hypothetical protein [Selenomonadaceae bacterium]